MRNLLAASAAASMVAAQMDGGECTYAVEMMYVQDASMSFDPWVTTMMDEVKNILADLSVMYAEFKMGIASFTDKPIPSLGLGNFGGFNRISDYCYHLHAPMTADPSSLSKGLDDLHMSMGSGGDFPEAPFDGLAYAVGDESVGWAEPSVEFTAAGRPIVRVVMVVTDDVSHQPGDAAKAVYTNWEYPRTWTNATHSVGGFGATQYLEYGTIDRWKHSEEYLAMSSLFYKYDSGSLTDEDAVRLMQYVELFGPYPWPQLIPNPNDGADPLVCNIAEYIAPTDVGALMREKKILPIFVVVSNDVHSFELDDYCKAKNLQPALVCLAAYYEEQLKIMGVNGIVATMERNTLKEKVIEAVKDMTDMICRNPVTTAVPTTATEAMITDSKEASTTTTATRTTETNGSEAPTTSVTTTDINELLTTSASTTDRNEARTTVIVANSSTGGAINAPDTTGTAAVVPPPDEGSNAGLIAGATAGAAAGLAVLGGALYRTFGTSLFGGNAGMPTGAAAQVEVPENTLQRETMEEVTMDMFQ